MDELTGANPIDAYSKPSLSGGVASSISPAQKSGMDVSELAGLGGAAALPFMATPAGAAVVVGSQFLSNYLAQDAADKRAAKERRMQIAQQQGAGEQRGLENLMNAYRGMTRG